MKPNRYPFIEPKPHACWVCQGELAFADHAKFCAHCQTAFHWDCAPGSNCQVCGNAYEFMENEEHELAPLNWGSE